VKLIAIDSCTKQGVTDMLHHSMFHGVARRDDIVFPDSPSHYLGDSLTHPIRIMRSGLLAPPLFKPCNSLVVSEAARSILSHYHNIFFLQVVFEKLVHFAVEKGDFSHYQSKQFLADHYSNRSDTMLQRLPDNPTLRNTFPNYFEVIVANAFRQCRSESTAFSVRFQLPHSPDGIKEFPCTNAFLDSHPLFWARSIIMSSRVFETVCHFIDQDYFDIAEINV
jgi:hypothetical protein